MAGVIGMSSHDFSHTYKIIYVQDPDAILGLKSWYTTCRSENYVRSTTALPAFKSKGISGKQPLLTGFQYQCAGLVME